MPYSGEYANPAGYTDLANSKFLEERLRTYYFAAPERSDEPSPLELLPTRDVESLPRNPFYAQTDRAVAIDGSFASIGEEQSFQLSAVKVGVVLENLAAKRELSRHTGPVNPAALADLYRRGTYTTLLPGEGVYGSVPGEDTWQDKFRQEFFEGFKHIRLPLVEEKSNLVEVLQSVAPSTVVTTCLACHQAQRVKPEDNRISLDSPSPYCPTCFREFHFTDFLFTESWIKEGKSDDMVSATMLIAERLLMQGLMMASLEGSKVLPLDKTVFIVDGPLAIYSTHSLNRYMLRRLQSYPLPPLLLGLEKTGTYARFAQREEVQAALQPGHVAMVTTEVANALSGSPLTQGTKRPYAYGKRFIYRTRSGEKTFVFMAMPSRGFPMKLTQLTEPFMGDEWETYPTLGYLCDFIESQLTDQFGTDVAALDIIAEANHAASLPKRLSAKALTDLVEEISRPVF